MASDGEALTGLWFDGQRHFGYSLHRETIEALAGVLENRNAWVGIQEKRDVLAGMLEERAGLGGVGERMIIGNVRKEEMKEDEKEDEKIEKTKVWRVEWTEVFGETVRWLDIYFSGRDPGFRPKLNLRVTPFQQRVCEAMLEIPYGETMTYGQIAARISEVADLHNQLDGRRGLAIGAASASARAVGSAVGRNPVSLIVPCHRVVGAGGRLTGYAGGLDRKARLLALERAAGRGITV